KGAILENPDILWDLENWANCRTYSLSVDTRGSEVCYKGKNKDYIFVYAKLTEKDSQNASEVLYIDGKDRQICFYLGVNGANDFMRVEDNRLANIIEELTGADSMSVRSELRPERRDVPVHYIKLKNGEKVNQATVEYIAKILE
ncbi:MAG: hypothetical protein AABX39_05495, partial [Nanoarchaeota archaeon]